MKQGIYTVRSSRILIMQMLNFMHIEEYNMKSKHSGSVTYYVGKDGVCYYEYSTKIWEEILPSLLVPPSHPNPPLKSIPSDNLSEILASIKKPNNPN